MNSVLIVSSNDKSTDMLVQLIKAENTPQISTADNGSEARRALLINDYDIIIINAPLLDEFGHELAISTTENSTAGVILIVKSELCDAVTSKVEDYGVLVVTKPISKVAFFQTLKLANASRKRMMGIQKENAKLHNKLEEMRLIDRAKCVLIQYLKLTEPQAHRHIEKQAMDMRLTKKDVAESILRTYEM